MQSCASGIFHCKTSLSTVSSEAFEKSSVPEFQIAQSYSRDSFCAVVRSGLYSSAVEWKEKELDAVHVYGWSGDSEQGPDAVN